MTIRKRQLKILGHIIKEKDLSTLKRNGEETTKKTVLKFLSKRMTEESVGTSKVHKNK